MKLLRVLCFVAVVAAVPPSRTSNSNNDVSVLAYENVNLGNGRYKYSFEQSDGTKAEQTGEIKNEGQDNEALSVSGHFEWISPDGHIRYVSYTADEKGYKAQVDEGINGKIPQAVIEALGLDHS